MTSATGSQPGGRLKLLLPSPAAETSNTIELPAWLAPDSVGVKVVAIVKSCWLLWTMVNVDGLGDGVGVGVAVGAGVGVGVAVGAGMGAGRVGTMEMASA